MFFQALRQLMNERACDGMCLHRLRGRRNAEGLDRSFAADTAARGRIEMAIEFARVDPRAFPQRDANDVRRRPMPHGLDLAGAVKQSLREQKTYGQIAVIAGRPHRDRDILLTRLAVDDPRGADLQRLLDDHDVVGAGGVIADNTGHIDGCRSRIGHATILMPRRAAVTICSP